MVSVTTYLVKNDNTYSVVKVTHIVNKLGDSKQYIIFLFKMRLGLNLIYIKIQNSHHNVKSLSTYSATADYGFIDN